MSLIALRRDSPFRPPNWRSQLAAVITGHTDRRLAERVRAWGDDRVEDLIRLGAGGLDPRHPFASVTALRDPTMAELRVEIEARVLAGLSSVEIAGATGQAEETVEWFAAAHFDVRDRLDARGYIRTACLEEPPTPADRTHPPYGLAKWYGYFHGPLALDAVLDTFRHWDTDRRPARGLTAAELSRRALRLRVRAAVLARSLPVSDLNPTDLRTLMVLAGSAKR